MNYYKKTAALAAGLLIAISACTPAFTAFAETENPDDDFVMIDDDGNVIGKETVSEGDIITSGDYKYTVKDDGTISVLSCGHGGETFTLPVEIDGKKVSHIDGGAFLELNAKKIIIPAAVGYDLTENPFASCILTEEFEVEAGNEALCSVDNVLFTKDKKKLIAYPAGAAKKEYTIPEGTETIGTAAFYESKLESIKVPACVTELERHCFSSMKSLKSADLSETKLKELPPMTFVASSALTEAKLPETLETIEVAAFMDCSSLESITLPESLKSVAQSAFQGTAMKKVIIPASVSKIGYNAFGYVDEETPVEGFTVIGTPNTEAQTYCTDGDAEYNYQNHFTFKTYEDYQNELDFGSLDMKSSGDYMYAVDGDETYLILCDSAEETLVVPDEIDGHVITSIYKNAFQGCISKEITLPEGVKTIGEDVFSTHLVSLNLPASFEEFTTDEPFVNCSKLKSLSVAEGNEKYSSENGILFNKDKSVLLIYPQAKEDEKAVLPSSVKAIAVSAFCYNEHLKILDLSSVEAVGDYAFDGCTALNTVKFSENLKDVGYCAFLGCRSLKNVRVYKDLVSIGEYAFGYDYDDALEMKMHDDPDKYKDENGNIPKPYSLVHSFRMYADADSVAAKYAEDCGIETVYDAFTVGYTNVDKRVIYLGSGVLGLGIIGVIIKLITSAAKKSKAKKAKK
ncbi:MAG: leucine-rich repeat domain-containing protein [Oscillospiraceae bacterium]|nr:leucine-rich repeat domain-containing protein [Oscillospiraceae bacterium]MBR3534318.1 leucine-rich repeat domain-containing protein [Oscillospiraceae bacterium]